jgi:hypothetical protein
MARLVPDVDPNDIALKPERDVARALIRDLPKECLVYHSYCWLRPDRDYHMNSLLEGEADFLILDPRYGLLVLEVKGGDIRHRVDGDEEVYYRILANGRSKDIPNHPFRQASGNLHAIEEILKLKDQPFWFGGCRGYAVAFPDSRNVGQLPNDVDPSIVFFAEHLDDYDRAVRGAFRSWNRLKSPSITPEAMRRCREGLRPVFRLIPAKWRSLEQDEEQLVRLTEQQQMVISGLQENRRISIRGGAGTGKTMLALWQAVEFARCGKQTLLLCFNKALVEWLNDRIQTETSRDIQERLTVATFHSLCASFFAKAKLPFRPPSDPKSQSDFWENEVPNKMFDRVIDLVPQVRFDAVIVDEAQDFARDWWLTVESLSREPDGPLVIFFDPNQNLFGKENTFPSTNASFRLNVNCRNTRKIHTESLRFIDADIVSSPAVPEGIAPLVVSTSEEDLRSTVDGVLKQWRADYRLQPRQIAILSSKRQENTAFSRELRIAGLTITDDPSLWRNDGGVLFSTITAFKGLEADAVVLLADNTITDRLDSYVATSRAKHLLAIVNVTV